MRRRSSGRVGNSRAGYCDEPDDNAIRPITRAPEETELTAYLLVPGANHGGWWYDPLVERLEAAGHIAVAPTPLGLDPEAEPPHEVITLDDHVTQFVRALRAVPVEAGAPQGRDAVLVGHSYGGSIISAVADAEPDLVRALVYLDALVPENGDSSWSMTNDDEHAWCVSGSARTGAFVDPLPFFDGPCPSPSAGHPDAGLHAHRRVAQRPGQATFHPSYLGHHAQRHERWP